MYNFLKGNTSRIFLVILCLVFIIFSISQSYRNAGLKDDIKAKKMQIENLERISKDLVLLINLKEKEKQKIYVKIDSLQKIENEFKTKYYATDKKLKIINSRYSLSTNDDKWGLFTKSVSK